MALLNSNSENASDAWTVGGARRSRRSKLGRNSVSQNLPPHARFCGLKAALRPTSWRAVWLALLGWAWLGTAPLGAQPAYPPTEAGVKAGYLFNFTKYTDWPTNAFTNATAPLVLGVLGDDPFGAALDQTVGKRTSQGRQVVLRRAREVAALQDCHAIFICRSEQARLPAILAALRASPVVTVCDTGAFFEQGVMIKFTLVQDRVRFEVRRDAAEQVGIKFSSGLLDAALQVWPKPDQEGKRP